MLKDFRGSVNSKLKSALWSRNEHTCHYCRTPMEWRSATVDHIKPKCCGGLDNIDNVVLSCQPCNALRGNMPYAIFSNIVTSVQDRHDYDNVVNNHETLSRYNINEHWKNEFSKSCNDENQGRRDRLVYEIKRLEYEFKKAEDYYNNLDSKLLKDQALDVILEYYYSLNRKRARLKKMTKKTYRE